MLFQIAFPILVHVVPFWVWSNQARQDRLITATAAIQQAQNIQSSLRAHGKCVSELSGWTPDVDDGHAVLSTQVKVTGKRLMFECDQKEKKFLVTISFPRDDFGYVQGSFVGPLRIAYWHNAALETKVLTPGADIHALAKMLAFGGK